MEETEVVIKLSARDYHLLATALCAAQLHPECSEKGRQQFADLAWAIHCQIHQNP